MFNELMASVEQVDEIIKGNKKPSREFQYNRPQSHTTTKATQIGSFLSKSSKSEKLIAKSN